MKNLNNLELSELSCLHGEILTLIDKYSHIDSTKQFQRLKNRIEKDYIKFNDAYNFRHGIHECKTTHGIKTFKKWHK